MVPTLNRRAWVAAAVAIALLALPTLAVHAWMAWTFPSYRYGRFGQDIVFAFAWCGLLVCVVRWRLLRLASVPVVLLAYLGWLFLVLGEGVSYYLQADTFNARFFAHLNPDNLRTGVRAFPAMIGGGIAVFVVMVVVCAGLLVWIRRCGRRDGATIHNGPLIVALVILLLTVLGVDSSPRRLVSYLARVRQSTHFADTPQGRAVADLLDLHPVSKKNIVAAPGKNLVLIYMESLERIYWDPKVFPGLTPNLDRLRKQGLDFSGFETFAGANYTMAGLFSSQCGVPLFTSAFAGIDSVAGNSNDTASFHPKITCLGDVLHRADYTQVYMGGAPITFSNKGLFFQLHGYDEALGLQQLEAAAGGKLPESGWGLYDNVLFKLALQRYEALEAARKPFNLSLLTLDTHPPDGRPSPGCPKYAKNANSMLQAVHCTDHLLGKFIDALSRQPGWKNTVVVIMSDHLMMRNDAQSLFPRDYHRQPALLVLNAGQGVRPTRMYHMDVAPTLLDLLGVHTNATFIAGDDRGAPDAKGSELVNDDVTEAVLRKALWSRVNEFKLCKKDTLVGWTPDGAFDIGGRELHMDYQGQAQVGIRDNQVLDFFIDNANAKLVIADADRQASLLAARGDASVLMAQPLASPAYGFSVDWLGRAGGLTHLADIPRLPGLTIRSPHCAELVAQADAVPKGSRLDLERDFSVATAPAPGAPGPGKPTDFTEAAAAAYLDGLGWGIPSPWGSYAIGSRAGLSFHLPDDACHAGAWLQMRVDPYLPPSRPNLDAQVWINGRLATTWHFKSKGKYATGSQGPSDDHAVQAVRAPIVPNGKCDVRVDLRFVRSGSQPLPYPKGEDPRPLQLRVLHMDVQPQPDTAQR
jgi:arylsulfatase A-like enzyme